MRSNVARWDVHDDAKIADGDPSPSPSTATSAISDEEQTTTDSFIGTDSKKLDLRILLVDNHDSYTYNLYQYISTMTIHPVEVVMNDAFSSYDDFAASLPPSDGAADSSVSLSDNFDCVILSPGPGGVRRAI